MNLCNILFLAIIPFVLGNQNYQSEISNKSDVPIIVETSSKPDIIYLDTHNTLLLKGEVNPESTHKFLVDLHNIKNKKNIYLFLDTNGGSVEDGNHIVNEVQKYNISCIANRAYSMGFVILQACQNRYITPFGKIMQHQISYGVANEKAKVESYVVLIQQVEQSLAEMQSAKIGIELEEFRQKTYNDWWMFGENAIKNNCADKVVNVECSTQLFLSNYTIHFHSTEYIYSKCPLIHNPIQTINGKRISFFDIL